MPLEKGSGRAVIGHNIGEMIKAGYPPNVAAAASYRKAGKYSGPKKKHGGMVGGYRGRK